ncbi:MAG: hypothetical protein PUE13_03430 [Clostridiales bacterium]|nr:hypothetical protein [Clostridiales bacterium]
MRENAFVFNALQYNKKIGCSEQERTIIHKCYSKEKELNVLLSYWCMLYLIDKDKSYIGKILEHLNNEDYHIRCNVINLLADVEDDYVKETAKTEYCTRLMKEDCLAVRSLPEEKLEEM